MSKTKQVHDIIKNPKQLHDFIEWLPDLERHECYYVHLQARKKYMREMDITDKFQFLRQFTATKKTLFQKIKQLECPIGSYTTKSGSLIPDEALAVYITLNPRNLNKALFSSAKTLIDTIDKSSTNPEMRVNPHNKVMTEIHKAKSRTCYVHFDVDCPDGQKKRVGGFYRIVSEIVGFKAVTIVETRGGYHILIDPEKVEGKKNWYKQIKEKINVDQSGDMMIPVVGCNQGGFTPYFSGFQGCNLSTIQKNTE